MQRPVSEVLKQSEVTAFFGSIKQQLLGLIMNFTVLVRKITDIDRKTAKNFFLTT